MPTPAWSSVDHYENFPVASILMPARLRPAVVALYRFARTADDIADEGDLLPSERLAGLDELRRALGDSGRSNMEVVARLHPFIERHALPVELLHALLDAFEQDVTVHRYPDRAALLRYCERSANPVGRLLLHLFDVHEACALGWSDDLCTALQLINFIQDVAIDWHKGRVYLPQDQLTAAGASDDHIARAASGGPVTDRLRHAMLEELRFAGERLASGTRLIARVPIRLSLELRGIVAGGQRIIDRIARAEGDVFAHRPKLGWRDVPSLIGLAFNPPQSRLSGGVAP